MKKSFWYEVLENEDGLTITLLRDFVRFNGVEEPKEFYVPNQNTVTELIEKHDIEERLLVRFDFKKHKIKGILSPESEVEQMVRKAVNTEMSAALTYGAKKFLEPYDWSLFSCQDLKWALVPWPKNKNFKQVFDKLEESYNEGEIDLLERRLRFVGDKLEKRGETSLERGQHSLDLAGNIRKFLTYKGGE